MSSNPPPSQITSSKAPNNSAQLSPAQSQAGSISAGDSVGQRRSGGSGSFGAGASSRASPTPRNNQASRKQHKGSKRSRFVDDDTIAEAAAMRSTNSRKGQTSITHLMNFSLPPRPQNSHYHHHHHHGHGRNGRRNTPWGLGSGYHAVDKARYVHANYRFIVDPQADYHAQSFDADVHLDWNNVLQILVSSKSQTASCPICLGVPVAPRMAKCGHIFCLTCLIRYMYSDDDSQHMSEKKARHKKCPICYDTIYIPETRPVRFYMGQEADPPREGGDVVLRLVVRRTGSTLALPRDGADALAKAEEIPWYFAAEVMDYARVMKGTEDYMMEQFDGDIAEIVRQEKEDELMFGEDNAEWSRRAVRALEDAKEKIKGIGNPTLPSKPVEPKPKKAPIVFNTDENVPDMYLVNQLTNSGQSSTDAATPQETTPPLAPKDLSSTADKRKMSTSSAGSHPPASSALSSSLAQYKLQQQHHNQTPSEYYFYQALLHYYLSPLDIRILKAAFGAFSSFPSTILPRVERVSTGHIVDDDLRKRTKYLAHLPYGCEVGFLECDWTDTVPAEILSRFAPEIERRRKRNQEKESREEKARVRAEKEEERRFASARMARRPSVSERFTADDFLPLVPAPGDHDQDAASSSPPWPARRQGSSFATLASPSTSPSAPRTVWGTAAVPPSSPILSAQPRAQDMVDDGWLQGWEKDLLQENQLIAHAQALSLAEGLKDSAKGGSGGSGKKKKARKITLMSTNARRGA